MTNEDDFNEDLSVQHREEVISMYKDIVSETGEKPSRADFLDRGVTKDKLARRFSGIERLHDYMRENHSDFLSKHFSSIEDVFTNDRNPIHSKKKRFVITTAVADAEAHMGFLSAIDTYCKMNNADIIVMPAESITNSFEKKTATFDKVFSDSKYLFVQEDTSLNSNISLCSIQVSAKQIKPITGLSRIGNREGSYVFASPKQFLEYTPSGNDRGKNYSIMTPGACTKPAYYTETFVSKRLSYIAEHDHTMGAIIVEIQDDKVFHFRQIQCDDDGAFADLGVMYTPDGETYETEVNVVYGDLHAQHVDFGALDAFNHLFSGMKVSSVYLHDVFDGNSISHHIQSITERQERAHKKLDNLVDELICTHHIITDIEDTIKPETVFIVKSNHDEFLDRYLSSGRFVDDPVNHYTALKIATAQFEDEDVLKRGFGVVGKDVGSWVFLQRGDSSKIAGIECASHGDLGLNGARPSLNGLEKIYGDCVIGHNHSGAIQRGVFRVGTLSDLDLGYNRGPSSWTQTCCLVYENGQRQLINYINGKCRLED